MNVELLESPIHGLGVFARDTIRAEEYQYVYGLLCPKPSQYGFEHDNGWWEPFPPFRYTNHSNDPNCVVEFCPETHAVFIVAKRDIMEGEEITIDYGYDPAEEDDA